LNSSSLLWNNFNSKIPVLSCHQKTCSEHGLYSKKVSTQNENQIHVKITKTCMWVECDHDNAFLSKRDRIKSTSRIFQNEFTDTYNHTDLIEEKNLSNTILSRIYLGMKFTDMNKHILFAVWSLFCQKMNFGSKTNFLFTKSVETLANYLK